MLRNRRGPQLDLDDRQDCYLDFFRVGADMTILTFCVYLDQPLPSHSTRPICDDLHTRGDLTELPTWAR